jgi:hypothetical protein
VPPVKAIAALCCSAILVHSRELVKLETRAMRRAVAGSLLVPSQSSELSSLAIQKV